MRPLQAHAGVDLRHGQEPGFPSGPPGRREVGRPAPGTVAAHPVSYRPEIDGLRALAVVPVVLYHAGFEGWGGGYVGVDVFFVISGYLITTAILTELEAGRFSLAGFYERRARRILPALFLVLLACLALAWLWLPPREMQGFSQSLAAVSGFSSNVLFWWTTGYFDTSAELKPLLHTWSLAVEEQYYVVFPLLLMLGWRWGRRWLGAGLAVLALASLSVAQLWASTRPAAAFYLLPARGWELLIGALVAIPSLGARRPATASALAQAGGLAGLLLIAAAVFAFDKHTPFPSVYAILPTVGAGLVILCASPGTLAGAVLGHRALVRIGLMSYSVYLWHQPLFAFARHRALGEPNQACLGALACASLGLAYVSWRWVELPFRDRRRVGRRAVVAFSAAGVASFLAVGLGGRATGFATVRFGAEKVAGYARIASGLEPTLQCAQGYAETEPRPCVVGAKAGAPSIAVVGDSHAAQWADALDQIGRERGVQISIYAKGACAAADVRYRYHALKREYRECEVWRRRVAAEIARGRYRAVLVSSSSAGYVRDGYSAVPVAAWGAGVGEFAAQLAGGGRRVVWLVDNPRYWTSDPLRCFDDGYWFDREGPGGCTVDRAAAVDGEIVRAEREALRGVANASVVDLTDAYCDAARCAAVAPGMPMMRDSNHLTRAATLRLKDRIARALLDAD